MSLHINTPLIESIPLSTTTGKRVWLKMDALQPPGSFKIRGIGQACEEYAKGGVKRFISSSGGNAGIAVAYAGRMLSIPVLVVVPQTTTERAKALIKQMGAEVKVSGATWQEANAHAQGCIKENDAFIHPFDNPLLWRGHATVIDEVVASGIRFDAVILSVGGGGLYSGVVEGLRRNSLGNTQVIAVETIGADSFNKSIKAKERIELETISSRATSLGAKQVCEQAFRLAFEHPTVSLTVSDQEALFACRQFLDDHRVLVEPACGASLAPVYQNAPELRHFNSPLVIVCGGVGATASSLSD